MDGRESIESKTAGTILQRPSVVTLGGDTFAVSPPSTATLILVSELVASIPVEELNADDYVSESLRFARHCRPLGDILATLILGAKRITETVTTQKKFLGIGYGPKKTVTYDRRAELSKKILEDYEPKDVRRETYAVLKTMQIGDFFEFTASLIEINLLKPVTEKAVETAASGL